MINEPSLTSKQALSPDTVVRTGKRQKPNEADFPWSIWENLSSGPELCDNLQRTLELLRKFARDLKFTKSSILTVMNAPQFPNSKWTNIIHWSDGQSRPHHFQKLCGLQWQLRNWSCWRDPI
jgi:hypothetical protein